MIVLEEQTSFAVCQFANVEFSKGPLFMRMKLHSCPHPFHLSFLGQLFHSALPTLYQIPPQTYFLSINRARAFVAHKPFFSRGAHLKQRVHKDEFVHRCFLHDHLILKELSLWIIKTQRAELDVISICEMFTVKLPSQDGITQFKAERLTTDTQMLG
ncbi:hypothetical protein RRG08_036120 [Elysia crispata]|uniref:Uncharacterized protein n=1 Tax=Elysia crispata TaxID=231223 RepID=A0AAE1E0S6_9GAST|nr:hypothetical protein RRG08_036120 [Elysia crispata]